MIERESTLRDEALARSSAPLIQGTSRSSVARELVRDARTCSVAGRHEGSESQVSNIERSRSLRRCHRRAPLPIRLRAQHDDRQPHPVREPAQVCDARPRSALLVDTGDTPHECRRRGHPARPALGAGRAAVGVAADVARAAHPGPPRRRDAALVRGRDRLRGAQLPLRAARRSSAARTKRPSSIPILTRSTRIRRASRPGAEAFDSGSIAGARHASTPSFHSQRGAGASSRTAARSPASRFFRSTWASTSKCGTPRGPGRRRQTGYRALLFVGADFDRKGGDLLLRVFEQHFCRFGRASHRLVASPRRSSWPRSCSSATCNPTTARLIALYASCDLLVLPTNADLVPWSVLEAMAMQLPVVSTGVGAIPEIVVHDVTGLIVPAGDAEALANAIAGLLSDPDLRRTMGQRGRERIEKDFDAAINVPRILAVMKSLADGRRAAPAQPRERAPRGETFVRLRSAPRGCSPRSGPRKRRHRSITIKDRECLGHRQVRGAKKEAVHLRVMLRPVVGGCLGPQAVIDRDGVDDPHPERPTLDRHGPDEIQPP